MANEPSFREKIVRVFNMDTGDDYNENEAYYDDEGGEAEAEYDESGSGRHAGHSDIAALAGAEVLVVHPEILSDAQTIVNKIKENKTVVINFSKTESNEGAQIYYFLQGAVFALQGSINKIADQVLILAPRQVSVSTKMERNDDEYISPILEWDRTY